MDSARADTSGLLVQNLRKSYKRRPVIRDVSLQLNRGEVVALLGPNGAGKTTIVKILSTLLNYDAGNVIVSGFVEKDIVHSYSL